MAGRGSETAGGSGKPKLALYWASSCGGCEVAVVNLHERLLDLDALVDLFFCPCLLDTKKSAVEALPDREIAVTLFNGGIRSEENAEMARLLRRKSRLLVAFGSCASEGCIPGLANLSTRDEIFAASYLDNLTTENAAGLLPSPESAVPEGALLLPDLLERLQTLAEVVAVDAVIPGCPPEPGRIWEAVELLLSGAPLPVRGGIIGAGRTTVCEECRRRKRDKRLRQLHRLHEVRPEPEDCLLDQGIVCMGIATRNGCGALCPAVNMPCSGCYGTPEGALDQGAKMVAALGSIMDVSALKGLSEEERGARIEEFLESIPDPAGTFYKYSLPGSMLRGRKA